MTLLEALIAYCSASGVLQGDGVDSFRDFTPPKPDDVVVFHEYGGDPHSPFIDSVHRSVQVTTRSKNAEAARAKAVQLFELFTTSTESLRVDFTNDLWGQVYVRQTPFKLKHDESDRIVYCFNLGITTNIIE